MSEWCDLVTVAILVSRVEALCLADMLNAEGVAVHIGGYHHGTVKLIPLALGGYRIMVPESQWEQASGLIRETGFHLVWEPSQSTKRASWRVFKFWAAFSAVNTGVWMVWGGAGLSALLMYPLSIAQIPLSPQARGDYYLQRQSQD